MVDSKANARCSQTWESDHDLPWIAPTSPSCLACSAIHRSELLRRRLALRLLVCPDVSDMELGWIALLEIMASLAVVGLTDPNPKRPLPMVSHATGRWIQTRPSRGYQSDSVREARNGMSSLQTRF